MEAMQEQISRKTEAAEPVHAAAAARKGRRRSALVAWCWGAWLFASIVVAGLRWYPQLAGRVVLGLIAGGFTLFTIARASVGSRETMPASFAALLSPRMRSFYWAGYVLMFSGTMLTTVVSLGRLVR